MGGSERRDRQTERNKEESRVGGWERERRGQGREGEKRWKERQKEDGGKRDG